MADPITDIATDGTIHNKNNALTDDIRTHFSGNAPIADKAKSFAKARPFASFALLGVAAMAMLGTLRGRR